MKRIYFLFIVLFGFLPNLWAETQTVIFQEKDQNSNLFISGDGANSLYDLLKIGVPEEFIPNGSFVEGGNIACAKTLNAANELSTICALQIDANGVTKGVTPNFVPTIASVKGSIVITKLNNLGLMQLQLSDEIASKIYNRLSVQISQPAIKVGKNIYCQSYMQSPSCVTLINERGFADFPENILEKKSHLLFPKAHSVRGDL